jgi:hypothetical protein
MSGRKTSAVSEADVVRCELCDLLFEPSDVVGFDMRYGVNDDYCKNCIGKARHSLDVVPPWPERLVGIVDMVSDARHLVATQADLRAFLSASGRPATEFSFVVFHGDERDATEWSRIWQLGDDAMATASVDLLRTIAADSPQHVVNVAIKGHGLLKVSASSFDGAANYYLDRYESADDFYQRVVRPALCGHLHDNAPWMVAVTSAHTDRPWLTTRSQLLTWVNGNLSAATTPCATLAAVAAACTDKTTVDIEAVLWYSPKQERESAEQKRLTAIQALVDADPDVAMSRKRKREADDEFESVKKARWAEFADTVAAVAPWTPAGDAKFDWLTGIS